MIKSEQLKLRDLNIFSVDQLKKLQEYNITTAEQFVGICATPNGFNGLMKALSLTQDNLNTMVFRIKSQLPPDLAELLSKPIYPPPLLGARKPKKKQKHMR